MLFLRREQDNNLWVQALAYFARKEENCKTQIMEVLSHIDRRNLLPPLLVIQTLAHNSTATLAVVKVRYVKSTLGPVYNEHPVITRRFVCG